MKLRFVNIVKHSEKMWLNCVRVTGLSEDFQKGWIRHEEEPWEEEPLFLKVPVESDHMISSEHVATTNCSKGFAYVSINQ